MREENKKSEERYQKMVEEAMEKAKNVKTTTSKKKHFKFEGKLVPDDEKSSESSSDEEYGIEDEYHFSYKGSNKIN
jgi:hypothetical protein